MEKSILEKKINNKAKTLAQAEYIAFIDFCLKNKFARLLEIEKRPFVRNYSGGNQLFNRQGGNTGSNWESAMKAITIEFEEEQVNELLKKISDLEIFKQEYKTINPAGDSL